MQVRIITIPFSSRLGGFDDEPLRAFLADKQVHEVESWHFVHEGTPYWSFCVSYTIVDAISSADAVHPEGKPEKDQWRRRLSDKDWPVFNALKEWRKARADAEGVPPYLVFTNEQFTQMILGRASTLSALGCIKHVGPSRVEKYGKDVLRILNERTRDTEGRHARTAGADGVDGVLGMANADDGEIPEEAAPDADEPNRQSGAGGSDGVNGSAVQQDAGRADS